MPRTKNFDRQEVLEKAIDLFWNQGFHATSMQNLVDHLGINRASLYGEFGGKDQLYKEAFQSYQKESMAGLKSLFENADTVRGALKFLFINSVRSSLDDPDRKGCFVVNCTSEYLPKNREFLPNLLENKKEFQGVIADALQRGIDKGEFSKSLKINELSVYFFAFISGLNLVSRIQEEPGELEKTIDVAMQVLS